MVNCRKTIAFLLFFSLVMLFAVSAIVADSKEEAALEWKKVRSATNQTEQDPSVAEKAAAQAAFDSKLADYLAAQAEYDAKLEAYLNSENKQPAQEQAVDARVAPERGTRPLYDPRVSVILTEGFETAVPPAGWSTVVTNPGATFNWYQGTSSFEGSSAAEVLYDPALVPQDEWLISPSMDFSAVTSDIRVEFYWMMSYYWGVSPFDNYDIELWASTDGGATFPDLLWDESAQGAFSNFVYYNIEVSLAAYMGESDVVLAWRYVGSDGAQANIDFVNVTDDAPPVLGPGDNCDDPEKIDLPSDLPFAHTSLTCGRGNDYSETCLGSYDGGEDMTYEITVTSTVTVDITLNPLGTSWTGMLLDDLCPADGSCLAVVNNGSSSSPYSILGLTLNPGVYYLMIDTWPTPDCIPEFDLTITEAAVPDPGDNCSNPLPIEIPSSLPYSDNGQTTCGHGNNYSATCLGSYDGGEDIMYELTVTSEVTVDIILDPLGTTYTGILIDDVCPPGGTGACIDFSSSSGGSPHGMTDLTLAAGTYYIMVDTWPTPDCIPEFDLHISESAPAEPGDNCSNPLKIDIPALPYSDLGQTTCGRGDNYDATCLGSYDGGEDIVYELTVLSEVTVDITLDPLGTTYTGILIDDACPPGGTGECIATSTSSGGAAHTMYALTLSPGTYYLMVDTWPAPDCIPSFDLYIDGAGAGPANDNWEDAEKVDDLTDYPFCTAGATADGPGACQSCPNVWFCYTASCDGNVTVDLCGSTYDTYLGVYADCDEPLAEDLIACNDDACGLQSSITFPAVAGNEYLIEISGYSCGVGCGDISITCELPCQVDCPGGSFDEGEPCGDDTNGGCNNEGAPTFTDINCGETYCGTGWFDGDFRDTDWYRFVSDGFYELTWTVEAEFDALIGPLETVVPGSADCGDLTGFIAPAGFPLACEEGSVTLTVGPGTYYFFVAPLFGDLVVCDADYRATLTCVEAEPDYCDASGGCDEHIVNVTVGSINNNSACEGYGDFTYLSTAMTVGSSYPISVTNGVLLYPSDQCGVHIDWNQDLDFDDADEFIAMAGSPGVGPYTASITPPAGALEGPTRMRVRLTYAQAPGPCGSHSYGEVEDYTIVVESGGPEALNMALDPDPIYAAMGRPINPNCVHIYVCGEILPGYGPEDVDLNSILIGLSLPAVQAEVVAPPNPCSEDGSALEICVDMASFVNSYGILYNTTTQSYTVDGLMNDATPFSIGDDFTYVGHIAGDVNLDESVNILDLTFLIDLRFRGGPMFEDPVEADVNADGTPGNIIDLTYLVDHFFRGGPPPLHLDQ